MAAISSPVGSEHAVYLSAEAEAMFERESRILGHVDLSRFKPAGDIQPAEVAYYGIAQASYITAVYMAHHRLDAESVSKDTHRAKIKRMVVNSSMVGNIKNIELMNQFLGEDAAELSDYVIRSMNTTRNPDFIGMVPRVDTPEDWEEAQEIDEYLVKTAVERGEFTVFDERYKDDDNRGCPMNRVLVDGTDATFMSTIADKVIDEFTKDHEGPYKGWGFAGHAGATVLFHASLNRHIGPEELWTPETHAKFPNGTYEWGLPYIASSHE